MSSAHKTQETSEEVDPIDENIQTVIDLHKRAESSVSLQQRMIEKATDFLGRPEFLFIILIVAAVWIVINILLMKSGLPVFDPPPFI